MLRYDFPLYILHFDFISQLSTFNSVIIAHMNMQLFFMIFGDFLLVIVMGFYAGVGIWESGTLRHITGMLAPAAAVWFLAALLLRLYSPFPKEIGPAKLRQFPKLIDRLIEEIELM